MTINETAEAELMLNDDFIHSLVPYLRYRGLKYVCIINHLLLSIKILALEKPTKERESMTVTIINYTSKMITQPTET